MEKSWKMYPMMDWWFLKMMESWCFDWSDPFKYVNSWSVTHQEYWKFNSQYLFLNFSFDLQKDNNVTKKWATGGLKLSIFDESCWWIKWKQNIIISWKHVQCVGGSNLEETTSSSWRGLGDIANIWPKFTIFRWLNAITRFTICMQLNFIIIVLMTQCIAWSFAFIDIIIPFRLFISIWTPSVVWSIIFTWRITWGPKVPLTSWELLLVDCCIPQLPVPA